MDRLISTSSGSLAPRKMGYDSQLPMHNLTTSQSRHHTLDWLKQGRQSQEVRIGHCVGVNNQNLMIMYKSSPASASLFLHDDLHIFKAHRDGQELAHSIPSCHLLLRYWNTSHNTLEVLPCLSPSPMETFQMFQAIQTFQTLQMALLTLQTFQAIRVLQAIRVPQAV